MAYSWTFANVWNDSLIQKERAVEPRDYIWASELGGSYINRFYKMQGIKPTNPPNLRSMRKFQAGNIWEYVVYNVLKRAGLIISTQDKIRHQYEGLIMVSGKQDFIVGGTPNFDKAVEEIKDQDLPEMLYNSSMAIIEKLRGMNVVELEKYVLEIKSSAGNMYDMYERNGAASDNHQLQCFHYLIGGGFDEGRVVYINKDNCLLLEFPIYRNDTKLEQMYRNDIAQMTEYITSGAPPKKEDEVLFDPNTLTFKMNYKVEYSDYLTMIYGYERPELYRERWDKLVKSWNRVYKRCVNGDKMTKLNLEAIVEVKKVFSNFDELVSVGEGNKSFLVADSEEE